MIISEFCKYHMSMRVVKYNGTVKINVLYIAKQYPENNSCFVHINCHWFTLDCKWLKDDVYCGNSPLEIPWTVKSAVCIFYVNLRKFCSFAIYNKTYRLSPTLLARLSENLLPSIIQSALRR